MLYVSTITLIIQLDHSRCLAFLTTHGFAIHISKTWNGLAALTLSVLHIYHVWHFALSATHSYATRMSVMWSSFTAAAQLALHINHV